MSAVRSAGVLAWALALAACGGAQPALREAPLEGVEADAQSLVAYDQSMSELDQQLSTSLAPTAPEASPPDCQSVCELRYRICDLSQRICDIADRHPSWQHPQDQCIDARDHCEQAERDTDAVCDCAPFQPDVPI